MKFQKTAINIFLQNNVIFSLDEALQENFEIRKLMPDNPGAASKEYDIYLAKGDFAKAYHAILLYASLPGRSGNTVAWNFYILGKDYEKAWCCIKQEIKLKPSAASLDTKSWILFRLKKYNELVQTMEQCLTLAADPVHRGKMLALQAQMLVERNDLPGAANKLKESENLFKQNPQLFLVRAKWYMVSGKLKDAEKEIVSGLKIAKTEKERASLHWAYAQLYMKCSNYAKALPELEIVVKNINTGYLEIQPFYVDYIETLYQLRHYEKAKSAVQKILEYAPENIQLQNLYHKIAEVARKQKV